jgi:hypothetical protein
MRAGRSDQSYLESGTNVQLVIVAISVDGRENELWTFKIVGNNAERQSGWGSHWTTRIASTQVGTQMQASKSEFCW